MFPYFFILGILIIFQWKFKIGYKLINKNEKKIFYISCIILLLFAALRGNGSGDYFTYKAYSKLINSIGDVLNNSFPMEIGFRALSFIVNKIGLDSQWVIILMNIISITCIVKFINSYSENRLLSIIVFFPIFLQFDMHASRTAVAISIGALGMKHIINKNIIKYFINVLIAMCFHKSALVLLLLYPIANIRVNIMNIFIQMILIIVLTTFIDFNTIVINFMDFLGYDNLANKYYLYTQSERFGYEYKLYDIRFLLNISIYFISEIVLKKQPEKYRVCTNAMLISNILSILLRQNMIFITRFTSYFNIFSIILIPGIYNNINIKDKKILKLIIIGIYMAISIKIITVSVNYKFYFI